MEDYRDQVKQHILNVRKMILDYKYYDISGQAEEAQKRYYSAVANLIAAEEALGHLEWERNNEAKR